MLTVRERQTRPSGGESDPLNALAIARITLREEQTLQPARCRDDITEEMRILSDYRRQLVGERIRVTNRAHADLCVLHPGYKSEVPALTPTHPCPCCARPGQTAPRRPRRALAGAGMPAWELAPRILEPFRECSLEDFSPDIRRNALLALPAYLALFCLDNSVRELVLERLQEALGSDWWDGPEHVSTTLRKKVDERQKK